MTEERFPAGITGRNPPRRDWLAERADASPDATALVEAADGTTWTYAEVDEAVAETAGKLASLGVETGDHLGVLLETRVASVRLIHAAMRLGAVVVPLNARLARPELSRQAEVADVSALVCECDTEADAVAIGDGVPTASVDSSMHDAVATLADQPASDVTPAAWSPDDTLALPFTSGTTGDPKAVELTKGNVESSAVASALRLGVDPDDRWLLCLSTYHVGGLSVVLRSALYGTAVVVQRTGDGFDPERTADAICEFDATGVSLVPTMLRRMLDARDGDGLADSLRFVLLGGAPASAELIDRCERGDVPVHPTYGMTETASQIATARPDEAFSHEGTVGRPLFRTSLTVVGEDGDSLPSGEPGELVVAGPTVTPGYYDDPDATEEAFGEHGLNTGDVGYRDESGRVWVLNRRSDRIVTGGENVHPGEVVDVLRERPGIQDAAVVGLDDSEWGERVAALVVPEVGSDGESDVELSPEDVRAHCDGRLAGYKHPKTVALADELPRTASGTVEREAVRERLRENDD